MEDKVYKQRGLFTPEEAALAVHLRPAEENAGAIAARAGLSLAEAKLRLEEMARKGLVFSVRSEGTATRYQAVRMPPTA